MKTVIAILVVLLTVQPLVASAQVPQGAQVWRTFAAQVEVGARIKVRFHDGRRVSATLVRADTGVLLIQPRTRVPVPVQPVPYEAIASIERELPGGMSAGRAALIGVASGAATFFGILFILIATIDD